MSVPTNAIAIGNKFDFHEDKIKYAAFSPAGQYLVIIMERGRGYVFNRQQKVGWSLKFEFMAPAMIESDQTSPLDDSFSDSLYFRNIGNIWISNLGELYILDGSNRLSKYDANGIQLWQARIPRQKDSREWVLVGETENFSFIFLGDESVTLDRATGLLLQRNSICTDELDGETVLKRRVVTEGRAISLICANLVSQWKEPELSKIKLSADGVQERIMLPF